MQSNKSAYSPSPLERVLQLLLAACGLGFLGLFYFIAYRRFRFPMQLEWAEGGVIDMVRRLATHQALYVAPGKNFVPFMYTPVYYYASAWLGRFTGINLATLRLVSIAATTGCLIVIFFFVLRQTRSVLAGWIASGFFVALFAQSAGFFDLARVDMLYLFFLLIALYLSQRGLPIWAAIAFALAFQTKQSGLAVAVIVLAHDFRRPRKLMEGLGTFGLLAGGSSWLLDRINGGWYHYYTVFLPAHQAWKTHKLGSFLLHDLMTPLGIALLLVLSAAMLYRNAPREGKGTLSKLSDEERRMRLFVLFTSFGLGIACLTARLHLGGIVNVTLPLLAWICILAGLSVHQLLAYSPHLPDGLARSLRVTVLAACVVQFAQLVYQPGLYVPTKDQTASAQRVVQQIAAMPGPIFVIHNVVDSGSSGKPGFANSMAMWDVIRADHGPAAQNLKAELIRSFQQKEYAGVLSNSSPTDMDPVEEPYLTEINRAAAQAYPVEKPILNPVESMLFYSNPLTPQAKPNVLYLPEK